jgi:hypothetical protein
MLPPIFEILTGAGFILVLVVGLFARQAIAHWGGRLVALGMLCVPVGMLLLSRATGSTSIGAGSTLFVSAGAAFLAGSIAATVGLLIWSRLP